MNLYDEVCQQLKTQFKLKDAILYPHTNLFDDLDLDSLDAVELIIEFEDRYKIELLDREAENIKTIKDIVDLLQSKL
jgi:acyl carrier protein